MADRLVDREPQVRRIDDEVVRTGLDRRRLHLLGQQFRNLADLGVPVPAGSGEELPSAADGRCQAVHRLELTRLRVDAYRSQRRLDPDPLLSRDGARKVGVELVLEHLVDAGVDMIDALGAEQAVRTVGQQRDLVAVRDVERVDVVRGDPADVAVDGLVGQLDRLAVDRPARAGDGDGLLGDPHRGFGGEVDTCREAPGALVDDADGEPGVLVVEPALEAGIAQPQVLRPDPLDPQVGVRRPELAGSRQCGVGERPQRQAEERFFDDTVGHWAATSAGSAAQRRLSGRDQP